MAVVRMFPAKNGDCFLVRESRAPEAAGVLIDGGFDSTFREYLRPELKNLSASGAALDLVVVTHIDEDHILGIISLLKANENSANPAIIPVKNVWHNSLRSISQRPANVQASTADKAVLTAICAVGYGSSLKTMSGGEEISGRQGSSLARLLHSGKYDWNGGDGTSCITSSSLPQHIANGIVVHILGPKSERLDQLKTSWLRELKRVGVLGAIGDDQVYDDAFEFMNAVTPADRADAPAEISYKGIDGRDLTEAYDADLAPNNGSSISLLIEMGALRLLFLADAWAEDIIDAIESKVSGPCPMVFDLIKISHHGSVRNTSSRLLELIDAPVFLISTNGATHGHPDFPVLRAIVDRPADFVRHLHFSYSTEASRKLTTYQSSSGSQFQVHENSIDWIEIERMNYA